MSKEKIELKKALGNIVNSNNTSKIELTKNKPEVQKSSNKKTKLVNLHIDINQLEEFKEVLKNDGILNTSQGIRMLMQEYINKNK